MAMPHDVFKKKCVNELKGLSGQKRIEKVNELTLRLPGYKDGPYSNVRKWLVGQKEKAIISKKTFSRDYFEVKKYGDYTFALIGLPSVGKSSLIKELTNANIEIASYEFTTLKPFSAVTKINSAQIQLIDLPGIIKGASEGKGFGKRVLSNAINADKVLLIVEADKPNQLEIIKAELNKFGFKVSKYNSLVIFTKSERVKQKTNEFEFLNISIFNKKKILELKDFLFENSNLIRIKPFNSNEFVILKENSKVSDFVEKIHKKMKTKLKFAIVNGSTKFNNQKVGIDYVLKDFDEVELVFKH